MHHRMHPMAMLTLLQTLSQQCKCSWSQGHDVADLDGDALEFVDLGLVLMKLDGLGFIPPLRACAFFDFEGRDVGVVSCHYPYLA